VTRFFVTTVEDSVSNLYEVAVLWAVGSESGEAVVRAACDALVAGADTPHLRLVAGVSVRDADRGLRDTLAEAFQELGLPYYPEGSPESRAAALKVLASRVLAGDLPPRGLTAWVHGKFGHLLDGAETLAELDDEYDFDHDDAAVIDAKVMEEAGRVVLLDASADFEL
jgi:hypothetical protein